MTDHFLSHKCRRGRTRASLTCLKDRLGGVIGMWWCAALSAWRQSVSLTLIAIGGCLSVTQNLHIALVSLRILIITGGILLLVGGFRFTAGFLAIVSDLRLGQPWCEVILWARLRDRALEPHGLQDPTEPSEMAGDGGRSIPSLPWWVTPPNTLVRVPDALTSLWRGEILPHLECHLL